MMKRLLLTGLLAALALAFQGQQPIPPCTGDDCIDDATGAEHSDQPAWCANYDTREFAKNCACKRECDEEVGSGCKTYCRRKRCHCDHGCDSR